MFTINYINFYTGEINDSYIRAFNSALADYNNPLYPDCHTVKNFVIIPETLFNYLYSHHYKLYKKVINFLHKDL